MKTIKQLLSALIISALLLVLVPMSYADVTDEASGVMIRTDPSSYESSFYLVRAEAYDKQTLSLDAYYISTTAGSANFDLDILSAVTGGNGGLGMMIHHDGGLTSGATMEMWYTHPLTDELTYESFEGTYGTDPDYPNQFTIFMSVFNDNVYATDYGNETYPTYNDRWSVAVDDFRFLLIYVPSSVEQVTESTVNYYLDTELTDLYDTETITYGTKANEPTDPTESGYTFVGWYTEDNEPFDFSSTFVTSEELNLHAVFVEDTVVLYTVAFNTLGGNDFDDQLVVEGEAVIRPSNPIKTGYTFVAWCVDTSLTTTYDFSSAVTEDFTLYARWVEATDAPGVSLDVINYVPYIIGGCILLVGIVGIIVINKNKKDKNKKG